MSVEHRFSFARPAPLVWALCAALCFSCTPAGLNPTPESPGPANATDNEPPDRDDPGIDPADVDPADGPNAPQDSDDHPIDEDDGGANPPDDPDDLPLEIIDEPPSDDGDANRAPRADAGRNQFVDEGAPVELDGSGSVDPDGDGLSYAWRQVSGPAVELEDADRGVAFFDAPPVEADARLVFRLTVSDGRLESTDDVEVYVADLLGGASVEVTADAGPDQEVLGGTVVELDGSGSIGDGGGPLEFLWTQRAGPAVDLAADDRPIVSFTAPLDNQESVVLVFELRVTQEDGVDSDLAEVTVLPVPNEDLPDEDGEGSGEGDGENEEDPPDCVNDADCDDGRYCNGAEACEVGVCVGGTPPCPEGLCDESLDDCLECDADDDCDNGLYCDGAEVCADGRCAAGGEPCGGRLCEELTQECLDCRTNAECDDGVFCNGAESCMGGICVGGAGPCPGQFCRESQDECADCLNSGHCNDGLYCNGAEVCDDGECIPGDDPCPDGICVETDDTCVDCRSSDDCDDGVYCNGAETCSGGVCLPGVDPCPGQMCDESDDACVDCRSNNDCDDGLFCNGAESCVAGACVAGSDPCPGRYCEESDDACADCRSNADCDDGLFCNGTESCDDGACVAGTDPCDGASCDEDANTCGGLDCDDGSPFGAGVQAGILSGNDVDEASGLVASRMNADVLWTHNDDGGDNRLFAINVDGTLLGTYTVGSGAYDPEDIAIGPGPLPGVDYLYWGDIGDNENQRSSIFVKRVVEPAVDANQDPVNVQLPGVATIRLAYPTGGDAPSHKDSETLLVDPLNGDIYVVTKRTSRCRVYRAAYPQSTDQTTTMSFVAELDWGGATGGDISPDGSLIVIRQYSGGNPEAAVYQVPDGGELWDAFAGGRCDLDLRSERQGEAICFDRAGMGLYTVSEDESPNAEIPIWYCPRDGG